MNSVGMGSDEIYFCMPFKTLNSVALEMELKKKKAWLETLLKPGE